MKYFLLLLILLMASSAQAATYWVDGTNSLGAITCTNNATPQTAFAESTIARGIACMSAGDDLYIRTGTYNENITATIPSGTALNPTVISAYSTEVVTVLRTVQSSSNLFVLPNSVTKSYVSVINIIFDCTNIVASTSSGNSCIVTGDQTDHVVLDGITVKNTGKATWDTPGFNTAILSSPGILMLGTGHTVRNSIINDNGRKPNVDPAGPSGTGAEAPYGIYLSSSNTTIENNQIFRNGGYGIHGYRAAGAPSGNTIKNNKVYNNHETATGGTAGILQYGSSHTVYNNLVYRTSARAGAVGITVRDGSGNKIYNNTVTGFSGTNGIGIQVDGNTSPIILGNIAYLNTTNIDTTVGNTGVSSTLNRVTDPFFVDSANADFRLCMDVASPHPSCPGTSDAIGAITAGLEPSSVFTTDIVGTNREAPWDIGAYESGDNPPVPPTPLLVAEISCDNTVVDSSGQANHGTLTNGATYSANGKYSSACLFDGVDDSVTVADSTSLDLTHGFTLEAWTFPTSVATDAVIIVKNPNSKYFLFSSINGYCGVSGVLSGFTEGSLNTACYSTATPTSTWTHHAVTYNRTSIIYYRNGVPVTSANASAFLSVTTGTLQIGNSGFSEPFTGLIDEIRVYNYARTAAEIVTDMNTPINAAVPNTVTVKMASTNMKFAGTTLKFGASTPPVPSYILLETGDNWLLEDGDDLLSQQ